MDKFQQVVDTFRARFGGEPTYVVRAPGRVNLIGEHTDYNDGFVMPMAIDRAVWIALRPRPDKMIHLHALDTGDIALFDISDLLHQKGHWSEYVRGVAWALREAGFQLGAFEGVMSGDVPLGAGLSSSAALELATARSFAATSGLPWHPPQMARLSQRAENEWVGVNCGIMDQLISAAGEAGHALLIDCRSLAIETVPLPAGTRVVVLDTATRRGLVDSAYNERRQQCEQAARFFGVQALRDVSLGRFEDKAGQLDETIRRRARHVISENERTVRAATAMRAGDAAELGRLMNASHDSLRDDFEVSSDGLNQMVTLAQAEAGCFGARMTGAGFGGCAVALVESGAVDQFVANVAAGYQAATGLQPHIYVCNATDGARIVGGLDATSEG